LKHFSRKLFFRGKFYVKTTNFETKRIKQLIVIAGPTASGKTNLAVELATQLKTEIISADSRQFYRELNVGTAKPSLSEMRGIKHHFIDSHQVTNHLSSAIYAKEAEELLSELYEKHDTVILVGGSGMYIDALCEGIDNIPVDATLKNNLQNELENKGLALLLNELQEKDPVYFNQIDKKNPMRVIRALEVIRLTGQPYSLLRKAEKQNKPYSIKRFVIDHPREVLYHRIDQRVIQMMDAGLLEEVKTVKHFSKLAALQTVGYKELFAYLDHQISLEEAVQWIQKNTRNYAKRQLTWFRRHKDAQWIPFDETKKMVNTIQSMLNI
jgi:tRNA dimethylallyltransferase